MKVICPLPEAIATIPAVACDFKIDQLVRFGLQRILGGGTSPFPSAGATPLPITDVASWDTLKAAGDATKLQMTPFADSVVIPSSEGLEEGGNDNSTPFGIPIDLGEGSIKVTGRFRNLPPEIKDALDAYRAESQSTGGKPRLGIWPINQFGQIIHKTNGTDPTPIPVYNFRVGSRGSEGLNASDIVPFSFYLPADWDKGLTITDPDFNAILEL